MEGGGGTRGWCAGGWGDSASLLALSVLKGYTVQHLPDGTVMVESIVVKVSSSAEDASMKVLLLSWSYQVKRC